MKEKITDQKIKQFVLSAIQVVFGCFIYSMSISVFYTPAQLLGGGVTGIAQMLNYSFGFSVSLLIIIINVPLFLAAFRFVDKRFTLLSLFGMLMMSACIKLTSGWNLKFTSVLTSVVIGGVLNGLGLGIIYRAEASAGGTDIISKIIQRYYAGNMAYTGLIINGIIVGISAFIYGLDQAVLTVCAMFVSSRVDSYIIDGIDHRRAVTVITKRPKDVADAIFGSMDRSATIMKGYGAYTESEYDMVYIVITRHELASLKRCIKSADPAAFFTITALTGVYGHGRSFHSVREDIK